MTRVNEQQTKVCKVCGKEKPIDSFFKNRFGYTNYCLDCWSHKLEGRHFERSKEVQPRTSPQRRRIAELEKEVEEVRKMTLGRFTPRELMEELYKRGYEGTLQYTEVHEITLGKF